MGGVPASGVPIADGGFRCDEQPAAIASTAAVTATKGALLCGISLLSVERTRRQTPLARFR